MRHDLATDLRLLHGWIRSRQVSGGFAPAHAIAPVCHCIPVICTDLMLTLHMYIDWTGSGCWKRSDLHHQQLACSVGGGTCRELLWLTEH